MTDAITGEHGNALERFGYDLNAAARRGDLEPVRCRDDEIARMVDILLRQTKHNPALVGAAGVGKTALVEGLAQRIVAGEVPAALRDARVISLDHTALLAGTVYRGQYEERVQRLVEAVTADPDVVLFIDEMHNLIGQGSAVGVAMDAAIEGEKCLLLKPTTFMNRSGQAVGEAVAFFKLDPYQDLLVVVDDLYLPVGAVRLRPGGGTGGHNGLSDIQRALGGDMYPRLRVGVGMLPDGGKPPEFNQADFVLSRFSDEDEPLFESGVVAGAQGAALWAGKGLSAAMNAINAPKGNGKPDGKGTDARM